MLVSDCCHAPLLEDECSIGESSIEPGDYGHCSECQWDCMAVESEEANE